MLTIQFQFPARRWHATPWGRQVNEGAVEWPPSPWRLLRSLIAVWRHKFPEVPEASMRDLIAHLTSPPSFLLPPATPGHMRHFMPLFDGTRTKVFDTFVTLDRDDAISFIWQDVTLSSEQHALLGQLVESTSYFGRAESWVRGEVCDECCREPNAYPVNDETTLPNKWNLTRVLVAFDESSYLTWRGQVRAELRERRLREIGAGRTSPSKNRAAVADKLTRKDEAAIEARLPVTVFDALHLGTDELRKAGWSQPPGSRWVAYARPADAFAARPKWMGLRRQLSPPTVARFAIASSVRPRLTDALWIGERIRTAAMAKSRDVLAGLARSDTDASTSNNDDDSKHAAMVFSGKRPDGMPLDDGHKHAHFLCEAPSYDARIGHITLYAPMGFSRDDQRALSRLCRVWGHGSHDVQLVLLGVGQPIDFGGMNERAGQSLILHESDTWISRTPVVLARHLKIKRSERRNPREHLAALRRELEAYIRQEIAVRDWLCDYADAVQIQPRLATGEAGTRLGGHFTSWRAFRRRRRKGNGSAAGQHAYGFRLIFPESVRGPIALGYGCHFGLGIFVPETSV